MTTPRYLAGADVDTLARVCLALASELWIAKDRIAVLEDRLTSAGTLPTGCLDTAQPGDELAARLAGERRRFVERVLGEPVRGDGVIDRTGKHGESGA